MPYVFTKNTLLLDEIQQLDTNISQQLSNLSSIRRQVDDLSIETNDAISFYSKLNEKLLSVATFNADISSDANITKSTIAYYIFLQGKERAVLSGAFSKDGFSDGLFVRFISLVTTRPEVDN